MLDIVINRFIQIFIVFFPIFLLPITSDSIEFNKMVLLLVTAIFLFTLFLVKSLQEGKITVFRSSFGLPLFFLSGIFLIGSLFQSPNLTVSLTTPMATTSIISGFLLYFSLVNLRREEEKEDMLGLLLIPALIISLWTIAVYTEIIPFSKLSPAGSLLSTAMFLSITAIYLLFRRPITIITAITFITVIISLSLLAFHLVTDQRPLILPFFYGWQIFTEILKNPKSLLLGVGAANFLPAFTLTKPLTFNQAPIWNILFTTSSSYFLTLATEGGIIAAALYLWILIKSIRLPHVTCHLSLVTLLILQLLLPSNMTVFILTIILLAFASSKNGPFEIGLFRINFFNYLLFLPALFVFLLAFYLAGRMYLAEVSFKSSLDATVNNQGTDAYNALKTTIDFNPYPDRYHVAFSQLNLSLANALAGKEKLSDEDKQNIPRLIQQSIDEARMAVNLYKINPVNWENLANTYLMLINFSPGAENWAEESYKQKIVLDPYNPNNYLSLGKLYIRLKKYEEAEIFLSQAVNLKPDYATPHYLLGSIYSQEKKHEDAFRELQTALAYLAPGSDDAKRVEKELSDLAKLLPNPPNSDPGSFLLDETGKQTSAEPQTLENIETTTGALQKLDQPIPTISLEQPAE